LLGQAGAGLAGLREKVQWDWIDHSALVRKLLREFREGDPARALRHAFSMAPPDSSRGSIPWGNRLPWSRAIYNLGDLLKRPGRGEPAAVWRAAADLIHELTREYRKAAEQALRAGDCRRAAYIYGRLLGEDRMAAQALQRGGLHRDAAVLYLKKLDDPAAAAQAFEAAGEVDQAIALYRQIGQHQLAGDLLRRIGEEDAALAEYHRAVAVFTAAVPPNYLAAGCLLAGKARRTDLAIQQFQKGWDQRPDPNALPCAVELLQLLAHRGAIGPIRELLDQGDAFYTAQGRDEDAARFYNVLRELAGTAEGLQPYAEELHDRVLMSLARRLRAGLEHGHPGAQLVARLLGGPQWSPPVLRDAEFAVAAERKRLGGRAPGAGRDLRVQGVHVGRGTLTAARQASSSGELFLGFDSGVVLAYHPSGNQITHVVEGPQAVASLAVDSDGRTVVALHRCEKGAVLSCAVRRPDGSFRPRPTSEFPGLMEAWLTSILPWGVDWLVGLGDGHDLLILEAVSGTPWKIVHMPVAHLAPAAEEEPPASAIHLRTVGAHAVLLEEEEAPTSAILLPLGSVQSPGDHGLAILAHQGPRWLLVDVDGRPLGRSAPAWRAGAADPHRRRSPLLTCRYVPPRLELVGLDQHGAVHAIVLDLAAGCLELEASRVATTEGGYLAATLCGIETIVAVSPRRVDWFSSSTDRLRLTHNLNLCIPLTIACFPASSPQEVLAVGSDGFIACITAPR
jgi:tetratricopeptide (TPR) repeat protein